MILEDDFINALGAKLYHNFFPDIQKPYFNYLLAVLRSAEVNTKSLTPSDWESLLTCLNKNQITSFFYWKIQKLKSHLKPPQDICEVMQKAYLSATVNFMRVEYQLKEVVEQFAKYNLDYLLLKGSAYSTFLYEKPGLRIFNDIDILVMEKDYMHARSILEKIGYSTGDNIFKELKEIDIEETFIHKNKPKNKKPIDLHWAIHGCSRIVRYGIEDEYFKNSLLINKYRILSPIDAFIHSACHNLLIHSHELILKNVIDLSLLAQKITLLGDWNKFIQIIKKNNLSEIVLFSLKLCDYWTDFKLNKQDLEALTNENSRANKKSLLVYSLARRNNIIFWFKSRWPENIGFLKTLRVLFFFLINRVHKISASKLLRRFYF